MLKRTRLATIEELPSDLRDSLCPNKPQSIKQKTLLYASPVYTTLNKNSGTVRVKFVSYEHFMRT